MSNRHDNQPVSSPSLGMYIVGDFVFFLLWSFVVGVTAALTSFTSYYFLPLWIYVSLCLLGFLIPKVPPGVYSMKSKQATLWFISFQFGRVWTYPMFKHLIFSSAVFRTFFLRCCGAKVSMKIAWSTISTLSDPSMLIAEDDVIIGIESMISGHVVINDKLYLKKTTLKKGCLIGARCALGPGVYVGEGAIILASTDLMPGARVPKGAQIGKGSTIVHGMKLEENKTYPWFMHGTLNAEPNAHNKL